MTRGLGVPLVPRPDILKVTAGAFPQQSLKTFPENNRGRKYINREPRGKTSIDAAISRR